MVSEKYLKPGLRGWATHIRQWNESSLAQAMACRLFGANPLPESMMTYRQQGRQEQTSSEFLFNMRSPSFKKIYLKISFVKSQPFVFRPQCVCDDLGSFKLTKCVKSHGPIWTISWHLTIVGWTLYKACGGWPSECQSSINQADI